MKYSSSYLKTISADLTNWTVWQTRWCKLDWLHRDPDCRRGGDSIPTGKLDRVLWFKDHFCCSLRGYFVFWVVQTPPYSYMSFESIRIILTHLHSARVSLYLFGNYQIGINYNYWYCVVYRYKLQKTMRYD